MNLNTILELQNPYFYGLLRFLWSSQRVLLLTHVWVQMDTHSIYFLFYLLTSILEPEFSIPYSLPLSCIRLSGPPNCKTIQCLAYSNSLQHLNCYLQIPFLKFSPPFVYMTRHSCCLHSISGHNMLFLLSCLLSSLVEVTLCF
jgi:hypothetical protein